MIDQQVGVVMSNKFDASVKGFNQSLNSHLESMVLEMQNIKDTLKQPISHDASASTSNNDGRI